MSTLQMGPLLLKVTGYAADEGPDFYEANWLDIDVASPTDDGDVAFKAACLMTSDIFDFMDEITALLAGEGHQAFLVSLEPQVDLRIAKGDGPDSFELDVELTPDAQDDEDIYGLTTMIPRSEVEQIANQAAQIIEVFPVRGIQKT